MRIRLTPRWRTLAIAGLALALGAALWFRGDTPTGPAQPIDIQGRLVDADGGPLARRSLRFHAQDSANRAGPSLLTITQADGTFVGRCLPGRYRVTLMVPSDKDGAPEVPDRYRNVEETPWEVTVPVRWPRRLVLRLEP